MRHSCDGGVAAIDDSAENSEIAKAQSAEAMNIKTSLQAFSNSIPSDFGNARDKVYSLLLKNPFNSRI